MTSRRYRCLCCDSMFEEEDVVAMELDDEVDTYKRYRMHACRDCFLEAGDGIWDAMVDRIDELTSCEYE